MKIYYQGDKGSALCHNDGRSSITFEYRNVPFSDGIGEAKGILAGVCDKCGEVVLIPAQSMPAISSARKGVEKSLEVNIPAIFVEFFDAAAVRVNSHANSDFRKRLFVYYVNRYLKGQESSKDLARLSVIASKLGDDFLRMQPSRRMSMKLSVIANERMERVLAEANMTKTEFVKSIAIKVRDEIVIPENPKHMDELTSIAEVLCA